MTDIAIHEARWALVTAGEYDRRTRVVSVNLSVVDAVHARFGDAPALIIAAIVAHERVHERAHAVSSGQGLPHEEEAMARQAATAAAGPVVVAHIDAVLTGAWA